MKRVVSLASLIVIALVITLSSLAILPARVSGNPSIQALHPRTASSLFQVGPTAVFTAYLPYVLKQFTPPEPGEGIPTEAGLKVAFIGDSGAGSNFQAVLDLIAAEGADLVLHQGDFSYSSSTATWIGMIDATLGPNFPYLGSIGNHDTDEWGDIRLGCSGGSSTYAEIFRCRMQVMGVTPVISASNHEMYATTYKGLKMVLVGEDSDFTTDYATFIQQQLAGDDHIWKVCSWHKNQTAMQVGSKSNDMGWAVYENCKDAAAIIATGHEHSYHRTRTLSSMQNQIVDNSCLDNPGTADVDVCVAAGRSFVFVSGLAGRSIRNQDRCLPTTFPYGCNGEWANIYTSDQEATHGVLFITFNVNNDPRKASGYFKNIDGQIIDQFEIIAQ